MSSRIRAVLGASALAATMTALTITPASADVLYKCKTESGATVCVGRDWTNNTVWGSVYYKESKGRCVSGELVVFRPKKPNVLSSSIKLGSTSCGVTYKRVSGKGIGKGQYIAAFRVGGDMFAELASVSYTWSK
ncbi:hypothetical protein GCM10009850_083040 [Nonomuraea monospora]|uniref:Secreted protein n=1 Tax=Nonomuraea monospora TaxID=568818 RepID=A0ABN3CTQ6_9ACTN